MKRLECLDGLRGVLAVYVMLGHMAPFAPLPTWIAHPLSHGGAAVDMFFVLSGLVITGSLEKFSYHAGPFLIARVARIFPVFLVVFAMALVVRALPGGFGWMPWIAPDSLARAMWSAGWPEHWAIEIAAHLTMTHGLFPDAVLPYVWVSFLGAAWSLSTEWQFYAAALCLGRWLRGAGGARTMAWLFLGLAAAGAAWRELGPEPWQFSRAFLPNKAAWFALGIASWSVVRSAPAAHRDYAVMLAAVLLLCAPGGAGKLLPPLAWTLCLATELRSGLPVLRWGSAILRSRPVQWCGATSYCIYLVNEPIQQSLGLALAWLTRGDALLFTPLWLVGSILLPILAASWLHRHVETPALRWGRGFAALTSPKSDGRVFSGI